MSAKEFIGRYNSLFTPEMKERMLASMEGMAIPERAVKSLGYFILWVLGRAADAEHKCDQLEAENKRLREQVGRGNL